MGRLPRGIGVSGTAIVEEVRSMHEIFPVVGGIAIGLLALRIASARLRTAFVVVLSVILGVIATIISGEALVNWAFLLIDIPLVFGSALVAATVVPWVYHRVTHAPGW